MPAASPAPAEGGAPSPALPGVRGAPWVLSAPNLKGSPQGSSCSKGTHLLAEGGQVASLKKINGTNWIFFMGVWNRERRH